MMTDYKRAPAFAALALMAAIAGCEKRAADDLGTVASDSSREGSAMVRLVNTVPSDAAVDVFADDAAAFSAVTFKTVTPFKPVKDNLVTFELRPSPASAADSVEPLAQNREILGDGNRYTIIVLPAVGDGDEPTLRVLEEPDDATEAGKARLRVVNAARGIESFDVYLPASAEPFFDDVNFGTEAGFKSMDAGSGRVVIRGDDNGPVLFTVPERTFEAGRTYTIVVTNKSVGSTEIEAMTIEDDQPVAADPAH